MISILFQSCLTSAIPVRLVFLLFGQWKFHSRHFHFLETEISLDSSKMETTCRMSLIWDYIQGNWNTFRREFQENAEFEFQPETNCNKARVWGGNQIQLWVMVLLALRRGNRSSGWILIVLLCFMPGAISSLIFQRL